MGSVKEVDNIIDNFIIDISSLNTAENITTYKYVFTFFLSMFVNKNILKNVD